MVGAGAGGLAQVAVYPLEVIQTRLAATHGVYAGILDATAKIWRTEGASAFMRCAARQRAAWPSGRPTARSGSLECMC